MRLIDADALIEKLKTQYGEELGWQCTVNMSDVGMMIEDAPTVDAVEVVHARWEDGQCSNCKEEALSTSWDEPIYDYDWEENLQYSHTETHTEYHLTDYCPNCGAKMDWKESE